MLVELLAAIPSVVLGLWGILVMGPFLNEHVEPWMISTTLASSRFWTGTHPRWGCCRPA